MAKRTREEAAERFFNLVATYWAVGPMVCSRCGDEVVQMSKFRWKHAVPRKRDCGIPVAYHKRAFRAKRLYQFLCREA